MSIDLSVPAELLEMKEQLDRREREHLSPLAAFNSEGLRRRKDDKAGHRQAFSLDGDRILHSRAYTRYIDKTQVFYMIKNDHITHRVLHVQLVSKIARTIGRFLRLNEDLIEAIALGHDIGHPPFGHDGEKMLDILCREHGLDSFQHNIQSVAFLDHIERTGRGWNLSLQTLDGILCHDGEVHNRDLQPERNKSFARFDRQMQQKSSDPQAEIVPMTLEGCVVRFADTIGYIGRDIEDAIELKIISRNDIPKSCREIFGNTNGTIVYRLVSDIITNGAKKDTISFSREVSESLKELKKFNYERIYLNPVIKRGFDRIEKCYRVLFEIFLADIEQGNRDSVIYREFLANMEEKYHERHSATAKVRDFIAGMTDDYFVSLAALRGCEVPEKLQQDFNIK